MVTFHCDGCTDKVFSDEIIGPNLSVIAHLKEENLGFIGNVVHIQIKFYYFQLNLILKET